MKVAIALLLAGAMLLGATGDALAEGGKVRGDGAAGPAEQYGYTPFRG